MKHFSKIYQVPSYGKLLLRSNIYYWRIIAFLFVCTQLPGCAMPFVKDRFAQKKTLQEKTSVDLSRELAEANNYYRTGNFDEAEKHYMNFLKMSPQNPEALYRLGNINFRRGRLKKASDYYYECVKYSPNNEKANYNLAITYLTLSEQYFKYYTAMSDSNKDVSKVTQILEDISHFANARPGKERGRSQPIAVGNERLDNAATREQRILRSMDQVESNRSTYNAEPSASPQDMPQAETVEQEQDGDPLDSLADQF